MIHLRFTRVLTAAALVAVVAALPAVDLPLDDGLDVVGEGPAGSCNNNIGQELGDGADNYLDEFGIPGPGQVSNPYERSESLYDVGTGIHPTGQSVFMPGDDVDNLRLTHRHTAQEYAGTALDLYRVHRYRETLLPSSFGPGVFSNYDISLNVRGGGDIFVYNMMNRNSVRVLPKKDLDGDGIIEYVDAKQASVRELRLYNAAGTQVENPVDAATAVLTSLRGRSWTFEIFDINDDPADPHWQGRLISAAEADGTVRYTCTYQCAPDAVPADRTREYLWSLATVFDGNDPATADEVMVFTPHSEIVGCNYPVASILLPDGSLLEYAYGCGPSDDLAIKAASDSIEVTNTSWDASTNPTVMVDTVAGIYGLSQVTLDDVEMASVSLAIEWVSRTQQVTIADAFALSGDAVKDVFLSLQVWWSEVRENNVDKGFDDSLKLGPSALFSQTPGLVRLIAVDDTVKYLNWCGMWGTNDQTVYYFLADDPVLGGAQLAAYVSRGGYPLRTAYADDWYSLGCDLQTIELLPIDQISWEGPGETYSHDYYRRVTKVTPYNGGLGIEACKCSFNSDGTATWTPITP